VGIGDDQPVAIKTVRSELLTGSECDAILARFRREADIGMRLHHPRIVRVRDYGEQEGVLYLAMEFVAGQELGKLLESQPKLPLAMSLALMLQVLNALAYAHAHGVIHRDIKPANILVRPDYTIILTDFGIAHIGGSELTQTGDLLGSPLYMAPEQLRGEPVDGRADLFAAGVVLYYLLTQRKPFAADTLAALMQRVLCEEPPPPSTVNQGLPVAFDAVLRRALAKDRETRFSSALGFAAALRQARVEADQRTVIMPAGRLPKPAWPIAKASSGTG
jgi:serine/threonine protein kinase